MILNEDGCWCNGAVITEENVTDGGQSEQQNEFLFFLISNLQTSTGKVAKNNVLSVIPNAKNMFFYMKYEKLSTYQ